MSGSLRGSIQSAIPSSLGIAAGHECRARGRADRRDRERIAKDRPAPCQAVEVGRLDLAVAVGPDRPLRLVVGVEKDDVGTRAGIEIDRVASLAAAKLLAESRRPVQSASEDHEIDRSSSCLRLGHVESSSALRRFVVVGVWPPVASAL